MSEELSKNVRESFSFTPVGYVRCASKHRFEAPRQSVFAHNEGVIELLPHHNFEPALDDLDTVERIWVVFAFHLNHNWRSKIQPPVSCDGRKIGVFATRSPHRPNSLGISCVELVRVDGLVLHIRNFDLLDGTPVFDIKPYVPEVDSFPESKVGWLEDARREEWIVTYLPDVLERIKWVRTQNGLDMENFCTVQLTLDPLNYHRKRVFPMPDGSYAIGCRAWKIIFRADSVKRSILVSGLSSGYTADKLNPVADDPYGDKDVHREYLKKFGGMPWME